MKEPTRPWFHFTRGERYGVYALLFLIAALTATRLIMHRFIHPPAHDGRERALRAAWEEYKTRQGAPNEEAAPAIVCRQPFPFDPNTLDSGGFIRLGLRPKTVHLLMNWRRKGKVFYEPEDLRPLYTLTQAEFERLSPYVRIEARRYSIQSPARQVSYSPVPSVIDLNTADSGLLVRLNGIGAILSHKIIERRKALGGFTSCEQLKEIYRFPDTTFVKLRSKLRIDVSEVKKLRLNDVSLEVLKMHPYIGEKMAKNIILFRDGVKRFENIDQLRQVPLMNEEIYRKIAPYFTVE